MIENYRLLMAAALALGLPMGAQATEKAPESCTAPVKPEGPLAAWENPVELAAAGRDRDLAAAKLPVGQAARVALLQTPEVRYALRPEKPGGSVSHGGMVAFSVAEAGTYRVALGSGAWVDIVADGKAAISTAHGHGPACTGIRKMVDFALEPGDYILQIAANGAPQANVLIARIP